MAEERVSEPAGPVTFLLTDIEGSTRLWEGHPEPMRAALARHDALAAAVITNHHGTLVKSRGEGDSLFAVFPCAADALAAACALQQALLAEAWPPETPLRVRLALHSGAADHRGGDYYGPSVNRCARLRAVAHGGQILLSQATRDLVGSALPEGASLRDLGLHRLKDLQQPEHLFQLLHPALPADFPPLRSLEAFRHNLPAQLTSFIGREHEIAEVKQLLPGTRLLTLTGAGGCGKTRLALQVAADLIEEYADGVWLVELAALADPDLVSQAVATALGLREEPGRSLVDTLQEYLRPRTLLLVLDNCEHLLGACAQLAESLLRRCPNLRIVVTSREGLGITGEQTYRVPSLSLPEERPTTVDQRPSIDALLQYEAVRLFLDRAVAGQPRFGLTPQNAAAVTQVCRRLDGIPLAIELAAARVKALPVEQIAQRLDDRFRLLTGGSRTALPRQQTLRALIDWSHDLLSEQERRLLRRLSVFAGGWMLEAGEAVCADEQLEAWEVFDLLTSLVEKSLVQYEEGGAEARYRLLETIRQYGTDQLRQSGEEACWRERHRDWYLGLAEQAGPELQGPEMARWHARLEQEHDNLRAAQVWTLARGEAELGLRFGVALWRFWDVRGHWAEGRARLAEVLALSANERTLMRVRALIAAGTLADQQCDYDAAWALAEECLTLCRELKNPRGIASSLLVMANVAWSRGELPKARSLLEEVLEIEREQAAPRGIAAALNNLAGVVYEQGDLQTARSYYEEALTVRRPLGDRRGIATSLTNLGMVTHVQGDVGAAWNLYQEALAIFRELGDRQNTATVLQNLGSVRSSEEDWEGARLLYEESLATRRELDEKRGIASSLSKLGTLARRRGEYDRSYECHVESLNLHQEIGNRLGMVEDLNDLGLVATARGQAARAARLLGAAEAEREALGAPLFPVDQADTNQAVAELRAVIGEEAFAAAQVAGQAMSLDEAIAFALEETHHEPG